MMASAEFAEGPTGDHNYQPDPEDLGVTARLARSGNLPISAIEGDAVYRVRGTATLAEVAAVLTDLGIGAVAVGNGAVEGIISERDIVGSIRDGLDPMTATAAQIVHTDLIWVTPDTTVDEVARLMIDQCIRHVFIGRLHSASSIISARDLLSVYAPSAPADDPNED